MFRYYIIAEDKSKSTVVYKANSLAVAREYAIGLKIKNKFESTVITELKEVLMVDIKFEEPAELEGN